MQDARTRTATGALTVTLTLVGWSSVPLFLRYFADYIDAWTSNGWRYGFSALLWAPLLVVGALRGRLPPGLWRAAIVPSIVNSIGQVTFVWAHYRIDPGLLSFGLRSQVLFAAVGAYLLFASERRVIRSPMFLLGMVAVLLGTAGSMLKGRHPIDWAQAEGIVLALASGALFAGYALAVRRYMSKFGSIVAFAAISQYTATVMVVLMLVLGRHGGLEVVELSSRDVGLLLISAVIGIALGHVFYYMSIARLGVAVSSGVLQLHPFGVAVASYYVFNEVLTRTQWISGGAAVVGALMMVSVQSRIARRIEREAVRALTVQAE
jgi:drug/metabolite transporter (DMT)-like permease